MSYKILITGGAGYLGSILTPRLLQLGHKVTVLDSFTHNQPSLAAVCFDKNLSIVRGDARDPAILKSLVRDADFVFPLAALVGAPMCDQDPEAATSTNTGAVRTLLSLLSPSQRVIIPITNSGYGIGESGQFCTEESPLKPISHYGRTKVEAEKIVLDRDGSISLRLATVFGISPRLRLDLLVNDFTYRAVRDRFIVIFEGHFKRNYIHIQDVASAFIHAMGSFDAMKNLPYNVGLSDANLSKLELCEEIKKQVPGFVIIEAQVGEDPDKRDYIVSNERIEKTGFKPGYSLQDGISELIKGYSMLRKTMFGNV
jgi:nucleoside-diphosphate-sugar epimerase